jgi:hypothetical protein
MTTIADDLIARLEAAAKECRYCLHGLPFKLTKEGREVHINEKTGTAHKCETELFREAAAALASRPWKTVITDDAIRQIIRPIRGCATDEQYQDIYSRVEHALTLASRQAGADGWQDIATAPKDGTWVIIWVTPGHLNADKRASPVIATWDTVLNPCWIDEYGDEIEEIASHWMPSPAPPLSAAPKQGDK